MSLLFICMPIKQFFDIITRLNNLDNYMIYGIHFQLVNSKIYYKPLKSS